MADCLLLGNLRSCCILWEVKVLGLGVTGEIWLLLELVPLLDGIMGRLGEWLLLLRREVIVFRRKVACRQSRILSQAPRLLLLGRGL